MMKAHLVFAEVTDVIHSHENSEQLPVLLKVQTLQEEEKPELREHRCT